MFSSGQWLENNGQFLVNWASQAYCNYSIFVGVLLLVISSIQTYRMSIFAYKKTDRLVILCYNVTEAKIVLSSIEVHQSFKVCACYKTNAAPAAIKCTILLQPQQCVHTFTLKTIWPKVTFIPHAGFKVE